MADSQKTIPLSYKKSRTDQFLKWLVLVYILLASLIFLLIPFQAAAWLNTPFLGGFLEPNMEFSNISTTDLARSWPVHQLGLARGYHLEKLNGQPVADAADVLAILKPLKVGQPVQMQVRTPQGEVGEYTITLGNFDAPDNLTFFYFPYLVGLIYLAVAFWIFTIRRHQSNGRTFAILMASFGVLIAGMYDMFTGHLLVPVWSLAMGFGTGSLLGLAMTFPQEDPVVGQRPYLRGLGYVLGVFFALLSLYSLMPGSRLDFVQTRRWQMLVAIMMILISIFWFMWRRMRLISPVGREQVRLMLWGLVLSFLPVGVWLALVSILGENFRFTPYVLLFMLIFPFATGYTIQRYRLVHTDYVLSRAILYGVMVLLVSVGYGLVVAGLALSFGWMANNPVVMGALIVMIALIIHPLRQKLETFVDAIFFRGEKVYQDALQTFSRDLTALIDLQSIAHAQRRYVNETLSPKPLHIYILDPFREVYYAMPAQDGRPTSDLIFQPASPLVRVLSEQRGSMYIPDLRSLPENLQSDQVRIQILGAQLFVPLPGRQRLAGWMALGPRLSGDPYAGREIAFLEAISDQSVLAIERAQVVTNMEKRVREMNVLARVAQGINITVSLDDILELIYAQTIQVVPATDFQLWLVDRAATTANVIFYVENDERLVQYENKPPFLGQGMEYEVIQQRKPIITDDYVLENEKRGLPLPKNSLYAWAGVPLNAGAETIGVMVLGHRDVHVTYNKEQLNLLQAIADQAAGAIVKTRLLQETERRARQLARLNEVTRNLTSTLELEPLLQTILQSAVEILDCEAGSLLLVDERSQELVFKVVTGPVAEDLLGKRLARGVGNVGKSVVERTAIIVNDVHKSNNWFSQTDQQTGFITRALLVVPLEVKDTAIGVIEVINKRDGSSFNNDDQQLLTAFASQAAIAIENARLYTNTDQALAARVNQLEELHQFDKELNSSLNITRTMRTVLEWALKISGQKNGFAGIVLEDGLQILVSEGYGSELEAYQQALLSFDELVTPENIGSSDHLFRNFNSTTLHGILNASASQTIIPIRRETRIIAMIVMESLTTDAPLNLDFVVQLMDHASAGISNAQLYAAVEAANVAKSEFVSFVSHELKNPMTSIKGYTELLAAGAVGPINDAQSNFLSTIRSNVERMSTLVSDLADVSRIEAGRLKLEFKPVAIKDAMDDVVRSLRKQIEDKKQKLVMNIPADLPMVWADKLRVVQVATNLVSNAYKYTGQEGVIEVSAEVSDNLWDPTGARRVVHLWVKDSGIGIAPEDQKKIFQKFFRSEDPKTREAPGTGLGLNITRSLVEMQGGRIWFDSEFRKGTTFHITIPIAES
jgi:signal transduction histidine kinase